MLFQNLEVLICEDTTRHREIIEKIVHNHISTMASDNMQLAVSTASPYEIISHIEDHPNKNRLIFVDVDLNNELDGIHLASKVRKLDANAMIVFVTSHYEQAHLTYTYKIDAYDYIVKDGYQNVKKRVNDVIKIAYERFCENNSSDTKIYAAKVGNEVLYIPYDDIVFFVTHPTIQNRLTLVTKDGVSSVRGRIKDVASLDYRFFRCNQSYVVNTCMIKRIVKSDNELEMTNEEFIPIAPRKIPKLIKTMKRNILHSENKESS